jgi:hypothetical protein
MIFLFFGYVVGLEKEWGYFLLSELTAAHGPGPGHRARPLLFPHTLQYGERVATQIIRAEVRRPSAFRPHDYPAPASRGVFVALTFAAPRNISRLVRIQPADTLMSRFDWNFLSKLNAH